MAANSAIIKDQLIEARVEEIRARRNRDEPEIVGSFSPDGEVANFVASGALKSNEGDTVIIVSTQDGEPREIPSVQLKHALKKKNPATGKRNFEMIDPDTGQLTGPVPEFVRGEVPCWFNPNSEQYEALQQIAGLRGFQCASEHLASPFDAEMHARNRHARRYQVAKDAMERIEREEDRRIRREEIKAMRAMATAATKAG